MLEGAPEQDASDDDDYGAEARLLVCVDGHVAERHFRLCPRRKRQRNCRSLRGQIRTIRAAPTEVQLVGDAYLIGVRRL
jgi:hypothetical protein